MKNFTARQAMAVNRGARDKFHRWREVISSLPPRRTRVLNWPAAQLFAKGLYDGLFGSGRIARIFGNIGGWSLNCPELRTWSVYFARAFLWVAPLISAETDIVLLCVLDLVSLANLTASNIPFEAKKSYLTQGLNRIESQQLGRG